MRRQTAIDMARWAAGHVPLYRELYGGVPAIESWRDFRRLPVLTPARLRATPFAEQVDDPRDTLRTFTPYQLQSKLTPCAMVSDAADTDTAFLECRDAFARAGVRRAARLVVLSAPHQRYFAAELAERLGYFAIQTHVLVHRDDGALVRLVAALAPDHILGAGTDGAAPVRPNITVRDPSSLGPDLYVVPEAGIVAVRPKGEESYRPLTRYYLFEAERDGRLLLTALVRYHQPLVRYELPDRGHLAGGRLWLDEVAP
jgi:hypothetical protein